MSSSVKFLHPSNIQKMIYLSNERLSNKMHHNGDNTKFSNYLKVVRKSLQNSGIDVTNKFHDAYALKVKNFSTKIKHLNKVLEGSP